eukprot:4780731-Pyramimonas_sp.AAC.1
MDSTEATAPTGPPLGVGDICQLRGQFVVVDGMRGNADGFCAYSGLLLVAWRLESPALLPMLSWMLYRKLVSQDLMEGGAWLPPWWRRALRPRRRGFNL